MYRSRKIGFPWWSRGWDLCQGRHSACQCSRHRFNPWSGKARGQQSLQATTTKLTHPRACTPQQEESPQKEVHSWQLESRPCCRSWRKAHATTMTQHSPKQTKKSEKGIHLKTKKKYSSHRETYEQRYRGVIMHIQGTKLLFKIRFHYHFENFQFCFFTTITNHRELLWNHLWKCLALVCPLVWSHQDKRNACQCPLGIWNQEEKEVLNQPSENQEW